MKRIFITGGNRGLGLALVKCFVHRGDRVISGCRKPQSAVELQSLCEKNPDLLSLVKIDVGDEASIQSARMLVGNIVDRIDLILNNAAILNGDSVLTMQTDKMIETFRINTIGPVLVIRNFLDLLRQGTNPGIVTISSEAGSLARFKKSTTISSYACTKSALNMALRLLSLELTKDNIPVVAVHPGWVRTDMGGSNADLSSEESAQGIITNIVDNLTMEMSGEFFTWAGETCPW